MEVARSETIQLKKGEKKKSFNLRLDVVSSKNKEKVFPGGQCPGSLTRVPS